MAFNSSSSEFNEPEFKEYDSTPYDGGYDLATTYGKPLPPSSKICYPPSLARPNSQSPSIATITSPYCTEDEHPPSTNQEEDDHSPSTNQHDNEDNIAFPNDASTYPWHTLDNGYGSTYPWHSLDNGYGYEYDYGYGYGRQGPPPPPTTSYTGPCPTLAAYFPCLSKTSSEKSNGQPHAATSEQASCWNQWMGTEEYLFGSSYQPYGYGETSYGSASYEEPNYGYQTHTWTEQPSYYELDQAHQLWSQ